MFRGLASNSASACKGNEMIRRKIARESVLAAMVATLAVGGAMSASAEVYVQCPGDTDGDAVIDDPLDPELLAHPNAVCMHLTSGDGFVNMSDVDANPTLTPDGLVTRGRPQYMFGYSDLTGTPPEDILVDGVLNAQYAAPTIALAEGDEFYLALSNVGMAMRPDLSDPHTIHWHGYPDASAVFDGVPDASISIAMGNTLTYYHRANDPGTFMYHCHVEATEHMQMGMLGNLYVLAAQNELPDGTDLNGFTHQAGNKYVYNDGDGSTYYDVEFPLQLSSFDPEFHDASLLVQPLPFAEMNDTYPMINGRGYPETLITQPLPNTEDGRIAQPQSSLVEASAGDQVLLRISNLSVTEFFTLSSPSLRMRVVGTGAHILRGPDGKDLSYYTSSVTVGGGQAFDVILDTTGVPPGRYFLYSSNLQFLSNNTEDRGGIMTEIRIN